MSLITGIKPKQLIGKLSNQPTKTHNELLQTKVINVVPC